jgi:hypothetical protein
MNHDGRYVTEEPGKKCVFAIFLYTLSEQKHPFLRIAGSKSPLPDCIRNHYCFFDNHKNYLIRAKIGSVEFLLL